MSMYSESERRRFADETAKRNRERMKSDAKLDRYGMIYINAREVGFSHEGACALSKSVTAADDLERHSDVVEPDQGSKDYKDVARDFKGGDATHLAEKVAGLLVKAGTFTDESEALSYVLHNKDGVASL
jgi:hypothetical protein